MVRKNPGPGDSALCYGGSDVPEPALPRSGAPSQTISMYPSDRDFQTNKPAQLLRKSVEPPFPAL